MHNDFVVILVVEDEHAIQELIEGALSDGGFEAALAASGEEAVTLLQSDSSKYRALATDINLAGRLTGWDVAHRARELNPDIPVVYMSGAASSEWASQGVPKSVFLHKPFAPVQLVTAIAQLLNQAPPTVGA